LTSPYDLIDIYFHQAYIFWVKTDPKALDVSIAFARDVSKYGHWGVGGVWYAVNNLDRLRETEAFVIKSFESATMK